MPKVGPMNRYSLLALFFFTTLAATANARDLRRDVTLNSGYVDTYFNANEAIVEAPISAIQGYSWLFDAATENFRDHWGKRLANLLFSLPVSYWLCPAFSTPFHEFGHARAYRAMGVPSTYGLDFYGRRIKDLSNFWSLGALRVLSPPFPLTSSIAFTAAHVDKVFLDAELFKKKGEAPGVQIMIIGAGINNQMALAKALATRIYQNNGHFLYAAQYIESKLHGFVYSAMHNEAGDPMRIVAAYHERGWHITRQHLRALSLVSLLSGSTLAVLYGIYNYVANGDEVVSPIEFYGFRAPEINGYINAAGLSFEIESDYRFSPNLSAGLSDEFTWKGQVAHEVSPRVRYNFASLLPSLNELWVTSSLVIGKGMGGSFAAQLAPIAFDARDFWSRLSYTVDFHFHHAGTLHGERNIAVLDRGNITSLTAFGGLRLRY